MISSFLVGLMTRLLRFGDVELTTPMTASLVIESETGRIQPWCEKRDANHASVLVVGIDSIAVAATAGAIDPLRVSAVAVNHLEAADRIRQGGIEIVVLLARHMDPYGLLSAIRSFEPSVVLIVSSNSMNRSLPEFDGINMQFADTVSEIQTLVCLNRASRLIH
jgi:hypothetical protein